ncbi:crotonase/enoyl-CoA hydratase family protein [Phaeovulum sp.]|uniref:crotonase/enoyl-CoA hydratase family protein n=1 Tax=Phaeovulum sp. TaxID=2934796 RepID=UPI00272EF89F|nr:crotonase/enoyl-CoA hydratase family protein [Phaeovulum sp.]MDP1667927.1 crotonase/enoyl-CoA hydratase family protein [Phaeovulum sp.]MDP2061625.1 crotonase/enoyl-CoA hydratase family protein [Phaeovulum sp.]MDP3861199.1 crotonase/enoyl-CoA hydratase family protein [Phaeovulum sp.]MDZ4120180.1 crotonase/enoyl-CoA hydratase family protein [Phaeovulum sp.]
MTRVTLTMQGKIAHVQLNRPEKLNAVDMEMIDEVVAVGELLSGQSDLRAVVLSGAGKAFSAGLDVASFASLAGGDAGKFILPRTHGVANRFQQFALVWQQVPVPVIAALHGPVFGAGLQLALGADIRLAHPHTRLAVMEMKWGLVPDMGGMVLMPKLMRADVMARLIYSAEPVLVEQALAWGLVTEAAEELMPRAFALAEAIAAQSPSAVRAAKRLIGKAFEAPPAEVLAAESREQVALIGKPDFHEAVAANIAGRVPRFG